jgi:hypothetical protein
VLERVQRLGDRLPGFCAQRFGSAMRLRIAFNRVANFPKATRGRLRTPKASRNSEGVPMHLARSTELAKVFGV